MQQLGFLHCFSIKKLRFYTVNGHFRILKWRYCTIYKAYVSGLCKGISPQNMAKHMVLTYLHFRILEFPSDTGIFHAGIMGFIWMNRNWICDVTWMMVYIWKIIPKWPNISICFRLMNHYNSASFGVHKGNQEFEIPKYQTISMQWLLLGIYPSSPVYDDIVRGMSQLVIGTLSSWTKSWTIGTHWGHD